MVRHQVASRLPCHEPKVFDGDVAEFRPFMLSFNRIIERVCDNDDDRFFYLLKYTKGEAHDLVKLSQDDKMRSCTVELLKNKYNTGNFDKIILERPISKLILLPIE